MNRQELEHRMISLASYRQLDRQRRANGTYVDYPSLLHLPSKGEYADTSWWSWKSELINDVGLPRNWRAQAIKNNCVIPTDLIYWFSPDQVLEYMAGFELFIKFMETYAGHLSDTTLKHLCIHRDMLDSGAGRQADDLGLNKRHSKAYMHGYMLMFKFK